MSKGEEVCLYNGAGGELSGNVGYTLDECGVSYNQLNEKDIREGKLKNCSILIIPGGYTKKAVRSLKGEGFRRIREFVAEGGGYIGICAGAYLASDTVKVPGRPPGLRIADIENVRKSGSGMKEIYLKEHPITKGVTEELEIYWQNGPWMIIKEESEMKKIATYQNGKGAIVAGSYGNGKMVIFSPHPEGMISRGIEPTPETLILLENSIQFCEVKEENEN